MLIFTKSNADTEGRAINALIDSFVESRPSAISCASLGQLRYLSLLKYVSGMVGNSSSGIIEAPTLGVGTVNIGDRQKGRIQAKSVISCEATFDSIHKALITIEEGSIGGFGSHVLNFIINNRSNIYKKIIIETIELPDYFIEQDTPENMYANAKMNSRDIVKRVLSRLKS